MVTLDLADGGTDEQADAVRTTMATRKAHLVSQRIRTLP
jgi:hypothetical protein